MSWKSYFIAIDVESTSVHSDAEVVEIAAVHFDQGQKVRSWSTLVCPRNLRIGSPQFDEAMAVNKIDPDMLMHTAPTFGKVVEQIEMELSEPIWVGHNIAFDLRIIDYELERLKRKMQFRPDIAICTMFLDAALMPGENSYRLEETMTRWGIPVLGQHRAEADAASAGAVLSAMLPELPDDLNELQQLLKQGETSWRKKSRSKTVQGAA